MEQLIQDRILKDIRTDSPYSAVVVLEGLIEKKGSHETISGREVTKILSDRLPLLYLGMDAVLRNLDVDSTEKTNPSLEMALLAIPNNPNRNILQASDFSKVSHYWGSKKIPGFFFLGEQVEDYRKFPWNYGLASYFLLNHCSAPKTLKGTNPLLFIIGERDIAKEVTKEDIETYTGDKIEQNLDGEKLVKDLASKFDVYVLRLRPKFVSSHPHNLEAVEKIIMDYKNGPYKEFKDIHKNWQSLIGGNRVLEVADSHRIVDCIVMTAAYASGNFEKGMELLDRRCRPQIVEEVMGYLKPLIKA